MIRRSQLLAAALAATASFALAQNSAPPAQAPGAAPPPPPPPPAAAAAAAADLPTADTVLQHFVEVTGGAASYDKVKTEVGTGTFSIPSAGISGTMTIYTAAPNKSYAVVDIPGIGKMEEGFDGKMAWENSAVQGARIKTGDEAAAAAREAAMDIHTNWKKYYKTAKVVSLEDVDGKPCYKLVLDPIQGSSPETLYFDKQSGLLVRQTATYDTPMGKVPAEIDFSNYTKQGDVLMPSTMEDHMAGQVFTIKLDHFDFNVDVPDSRFVAPDAVRALMK